MLTNPPFALAGAGVGNSHDTVVVCEKLEIVEGDSDRTPHRLSVGGLERAPLNTTCFVCASITTDPPPVAADIATGETS